MRGRGMVQDLCPCCDHRYRGVFSPRISLFFQKSFDNRIMEQVMKAIVVAGLSMLLGAVFVQASEKTVVIGDVDPPAWRESQSP